MQVHEGPLDTKPLTRKIRVVKQLEIRSSERSQDCCPCKKLAAVEGVPL